MNKKYSFLLDDFAPKVAILFKSIPTFFRRRKLNRAILLLIKDTKSKTYISL